MTQAENPKLEAFNRKMRDEGSAGFAAGPWDETDSAASARERQQTRWALHSAARARTRQQHAKQPIGDRVLTWAAVVALTALTVGVVGTWLSYKPNPGAGITQPIRLNKTSLERFEFRLERMEKRLSTILEPYIRMLNNLGGRLNETRDQLSARIRILEMGTIPTAGQDYEARLQAIENRLAVTMARLDEVSMLLAALDDMPAGLAANDRFVEAHQAADERSAEAPMPADNPFTKTSLPAQSGSDGTAPPAVESPAEELFIHPQAPEAWPQDGAPVTRAQDTAGTPSAARTAGIARPADSAMQPVAATARPPIETEPATPAAEALEPEAAGAAPTTISTGDWVINIASYTNESIARRKLADMQQQGIDVELVTAEVNGKTIYRARVFGFETRQAAKAQAAIIKRKLRLKETWIAKR